MNYRFGFAIAGVISCLSISSPTVAQTLVGPFSGVVPVQQTDYQKSLSIPKFDTSLGTLDSVLLSFGGSVSGQAAADNTGQSAIEAATLNLAADLSLSESVLGNILSIQPTGSKTFALAPDEGDFPADFAGADGIRFDDISGTAGDSVTYTDASALAVFTGATDPLFDVQATANSSATGSGNIAQLFSTEAGAALSVTYTYTPIPVLPEPPTGGTNPQSVPEASTSLSLLALAACGCLVSTKRRS